MSPFANEHRRIGRQKVVAGASQHSLNIGSNNDAPLCGSFVGLGTETHLLPHSICAPLKYRGLLLIFVTEPEFCYS